MINNTSNQYTGKLIDWNNADSSLLPRLSFENKGNTFGFSLGKISAKKWNYRLPNGTEISFESPLELTTSFGFTSWDTRSGIKLERYAQASFGISRPINVVGKPSISFNIESTLRDSDRLLYPLGEIFSTVNILGKAYTTENPRRYINGQEYIIAGTISDSIPLIDITQTIGFSLDDIPTSDPILGKLTSRSYDPNTKQITTTWENNRSFSFIYESDKKLSTVIYQVIQSPEAELSKIVPISADITSEIKFSDKKRSQNYIRTNKIKSEWDNNGNQTSLDKKTQLKDENSTIASEEVFATRFFYADGSSEENILVIIEENGSRKIIRGKYTQDEQGNEDGSLEIERQSEDGTIVESNSSKLIPSDSRFGQKSMR